MNQQQRDFSEESSNEGSSSTVCRKRKKHAGGRTPGSKNKRGHKAGRPRSQIPNQSTLNFMITAQTDSNLPCDKGVQTDPVEFYHLSQPNSLSVSEDEIVEKIAIDENQIEIPVEGDEISEDPPMIQVDATGSVEDLPENRAIEGANVSAAPTSTAPTASPVLSNDGETDEEGETHELNENEFDKFDQEASSLDEESYVDNYLKQIQDRLRGGKIPQEYAAGVFWVSRKDPAFLLDKKESSFHTRIYAPRVFLWFPHHLKKGLKCPRKHCNSKIEVKSFNKNPRARRIIDLQNSFYLMTMRYRCLNRNDQHTFNGFEPDLIRQLPLHFQAAFPAILTHRSGVSKELGKLMRCLFQHGTGPHRFQRVVRILSMEAYDELQLQYYSCIEDSIQNETSLESWLRGGDTRNSEKFPTFSSFKNKMLYNGYIPSANYLSYVYSSYITSLRPFMDQLMSFVDGIVPKGDHSFKIIDHMSKINGVSTFSCLYTVVNEYEEIRLQVLAHNKKMDHLAPQFLEMMQTYKKLGMAEPELFYTDNVVSDEGFLKKVIPSLKKDVVPIPKPNAKDCSLRPDCYSHLPPLTLPENKNVEVCSSDKEINDACLKILAKLNTESPLFIGFDCEWSKHSLISLIQVANGSDIYLFRVRDYIGKVLPTQLYLLLVSEQVIKLGRHIKADFTRIKNAFAVKGQGVLDIGNVCRDRDYIDRADMKLSDVCGEVLKRSLPKIDDIRRGEWEEINLDDEQKDYAALDAWVSWQIYEVVKESAVVNQKINKSTPPESFVAIYSTMARFTITVMVDHYNVMVGSASSQSD